MKRYYIEDENGSFWCENGFGYWSNEKYPEWSIQHRFEGILLWVLPLYLMMKMFRKEKRETTKLREVIMTTGGRKKWK